VNNFAAPPALAQGEVMQELAKWAGSVDAAGGDTATRDRVVADYVRHQLCHLGPGKVQVHRLRVAIFRQLGMLEDWFADDAAPAWADFEPDRDDEQADLGECYRRSLELLIFLKEVAGCGKGYYLPVPTRVITLGSGAAIAVSGLPTRDLTLALGLPVQWAGLGRVVRSEHVGRIPQIFPRQQLSTWLGRPAESLSVWTDRLMKDARTRLSPTGSAPAYEIYDPTRGDIHTSRWFRPSAWTNGLMQTSGLHLCRTISRPRHFWLAPLERERKEVRFDRLTDVRPEHARLLMYGIDQISDRPVRARVSRVPREHGTLELRLWSWPAWQELRLLLALGSRHLLQSPGTREIQYLPLCFHIKQEWWPDVHEALSSLGITIVDERSEPRHTK
jgi:hypothetical protein